MISKKDFVNYVNKIGNEEGFTFLKSKVILLEGGNNENGDIDYVMFNYLTRCYVINDNKLIDVTKEYRN